MNGGVHDFVVINTVKNGSNYPTGHGGGEIVKNITGQNTSLYLTAKK